jgi:hypothetical protein
MKARVRAADLEADRSAVIKLFQENLNPSFNEKRFDWAYRDGPYGTAGLWVLEAEATKRIVGAAAAFPRQIYFGGMEIRGFVLGDFCIHPAFRALGPALQLQRACFEGIGAASGALWYDFPSDAMTTIYRRLGVAPQSQLVRLAKLLRADRILAKKLKAGPVRRFMEAAANSTLTTLDSLRRRANMVKVILHEGMCGPEFTRLAEQTCKASEVCISNTAAYLNWRFLSHPSKRFDILTARNGDTLAGYLVLTREGDDAQIVSLRTIDDERIVSDLVLSALDSMRPSAVVTVNASFLASDPRTLLFKRLGFRPRESRPVAFSNSSLPKSEGHENILAQWHLMDGDRDT